MRVLLALDRLGNAILGGDDRMTITDRARNSQSWFARHVLRHFAHDDDEREIRG